MTGPSEGRSPPPAPPDDTPLAPVPDELLGPALDTAAETLKGLEPADVPAPARRLATFDKRGLGTPAARLQLRRLVETDPAFRSAVIERFKARPDVTGVLEGWALERAPAIVAECASAGRLPLLASTLWAVQPRFGGFGLGLAVATHATADADTASAQAVRTLETRLTGADEARRRAEESKGAAESRAARLESELKDERQSRRAREQEAADRVAAAEARAQAAEAAATHAAVQATAADRRAAIETARAERAEGREATLAGDLAQLSTGTDRTTLRDAARTAADLSATLAALASHWGEFPTSTPTPTPTPTPAPANRKATAPAGGGSGSRSGERRKRAPVPVPPGMQADTPKAAEAMLRTPGLVVVVDGYNASMPAWPGHTIAEQRQRLADALAELHLRTRSVVILVFDGAEVPGVRPMRRPGVAVVFSDPGEEGDDMVIQQVAARPATTPVIVVSSDAEVRRRAEGLGASVLPSPLFMSVLRR